jgi:hypothetical protein
MERRYAWLKGHRSWPIKERVRSCQSPVIQGGKGKWFPRIIAAVATANIHVLT